MDAVFAFLRSKQRSQISAARATDGNTVRAFSVRRVDFAGDRNVRAWRPGERARTLAMQFGGTGRQQYPNCWEVLLNNRGSAQNNLLADESHNGYFVEEKTVIGERCIPRTV